MLSKWEGVQKPDSQEMQHQIKLLRDKLYRQQLLIKEHQLPVIILVEGWSAGGKGTAVSQIIKNLDPRFFNVFPMEEEGTEEQIRPFLYRYFTKIPERGHISILDSGWMDETVWDHVHHKLTHKKYARRMESIHTFERQLEDDGCLLIKCFLHISEKEQEKRLEALAEDKYTRWRVKDKDKWQNKHYRTCVHSYDHYLKADEKACSPWHIIDSKSRHFMEYQLLDIITDSIDSCFMEPHKTSCPPPARFPLVPMPQLSGVDLDKKLDPVHYKQELEHLQNKLFHIHNRLYRKKIPVIIVYEGWDAAGKGGNITRAAGCLDPRGYEVHPISSPTQEEKNRHYLWRFWKRLPKPGHMAIFDRSWYGRVMVERLEHFCSERDWMRAYHEINEFEQELADWGAVIIKFWLHIDQDTQLERFEKREKNPEKRWKITDEDWRNREKWDDYERAVNEMLQKTSTPHAPWHILESNDKKYARIKALKIINETLSSTL